MRAGVSAGVAEVYYWPNEAGVAMVQRGHELEVRCPGQRAACSNECGGHGLAVLPRACQGVLTEKFSEMKSVVLKRASNEAVCVDRA